MAQSDSQREPIEQLAESFVARYRRGERPALSEYTQKHPELADRIRKLFPTLVIMEGLAPNDADDLLTDSDDSSNSELNSLERLGEYRILREVGRGGMGVVYEAEHEALNRYVALKVLTGNLLIDPQRLARFRREARAAARLHHTNIVPVFGVGAHSGTYYYVMQFIQGQPLDDVISELRRLRRPSTSATDRRSNESDAAAREGASAADVAMEMLSGQFAGSPSGADPGVSARPAPGSCGNLEARTNSSSPVLPSLLSDIASGAHHSISTSSLSSSEHHFWQNVARIGSQVAEALEYAHTQGILHRDIKPSNLLLDSCGTVWVTDFGLAKVTEEDDLTQTGDVVGTLRYMAPERFRGWADPRSDIYGLGLTLYELLTLRPAFEESDRARLIQSVTHGQPPRPRKLDGAIPMDLETVVLKAIAKEPAERYQSADELGADLRRFVAGKPIQARRTSLGEQARMWCRRNPLVAGLTAVVAALLVAIAVGSMIGALSLRKERNQALANLDRAETAERAATDSATSARVAGAREREAHVKTQRSLYAARLAQAHAGRWSGQIGRRFEGLQALTEAAQFARELDLGEKAIVELRNEAIACMALVDLRVDKNWPLAKSSTRVRSGFDEKLQRYACLEADGRFVVRRMADNAEVLGVPGFGALGVCLRLSPDGRYLAAKGVSGSRIRVVVWNVERRELLLDETAGGRHWEVDLDFSPNGRFVAFNGQGNAVRVHDLAGGEEFARIPLAEPAPHLCFDPQGSRLAVVQCRGSDDPAQVLIFNWRTAKIVQTLDHPRAVEAVSWGPDGRTLATSCHDTNVYIWDVMTGKPRQICRGHRGKVVHVAYSPSGHLLASAAWEMAARLWDPRTGRQLLEIDHRVGMFSRDERWLSLQSGRLELAAARELRTLVADGENMEVVSVAFSQDGRLMASAARGGGCRIWNVATGRQLALVSPKRQGHSLLFDRTGRYLVTSDYGATLWPLETEARDGKRVTRIGPPKVESRAPTDLLLVNPHNPDMRRTVERRGDEGFTAFSPDGKWVASGGKHDKVIRVREMQTGQVVKALPAPSGALVQFTPDGKWLVGSLGDGRYGFWDVGTWRESHRLALDSRGHSQIAFTRDARLMAVTASDHVMLLAPSSGREIARLTAPHREQLSQAYPEGASGIAFSPDGGMLAVGSDEGAIQLWDLRLIRQGLSRMGLDWDHPPIPSATRENLDSQVQVQLVGADLLDELARTSPSAQATADDAEAYRSRGDIYHARGFFREALADYQRTVELLSRELADRPDDFYLLRQRTRFYLRLAQYDKAFADAGRLIELRPDRNDGYFWRGRAQMLLRRDEQAVRDFRQSLAIRPRDAWPLRHLAWIYLTSSDSVRDLDQALEAAERAVEMEPNNNVCRTTLGVVYYRREQYEEAQAMLGKAAPSRSNEVQAVRLIALAMTRHRLGEAALARQCYEEAVQRWKNLGEPSAHRRADLETLRAEAEKMLRSSVIDPT